MAKTHRWKYFKKKQFTNWNSDDYDWFYSWHLPMYCGEYFLIWWTPDKFDWVEKQAVFHLLDKCHKHINVWANDYLIQKLLGRKF